MRLVQYLDAEGARRVGIVEDAQTLVRLAGTDSVYGLAHRAAAEQSTLEALATEFASDTRDDYGAVLAQRRLLVPADHPVDAARCLVTGTGLTHLGTGAARAALLERLEGEIDAQTQPVLALLQAGHRGGRPAPGTPGVQPEWFYKGDGDALVAGGGEVLSPAFAADCGDEAEVAALYVVDGIGNPCRIGYALANEFTDHAMEALSPLYMGHCKLRPLALGPELLLGALPEQVAGHARIHRGASVVWEEAFHSGQGQLCHSLENLEQHLFKYSQFRRPGDVHVHALGAATQSHASGFKANDGDIFEIEAPAFGAPLRNQLKTAEPAQVRIKQL